MQRGQLLLYPNYSEEQAGPAEWGGCIAQQGTKEGIGGAGSRRVPMEDVPELTVVVCSLPSYQHVREAPEGEPHRLGKMWPLLIAVQCVLQAVAEVPGYAPYPDDCVSLPRGIHEQCVQDALLGGGHEDVDGCLPPKVDAEAIGPDCTLHVESFQLSPMWS